MMEEPEVINGIVGRPTWLEKIMEDGLTVSIDNEAETPSLMKGDAKREEYTPRKISPFVRIRMFPKNWKSGKTADGYRYGYADVRKFRSWMIFIVNGKGGWINYLIEGSLDGDYWYGLRKHTSDISLSYSTSKKWLGNEQRCTVFPNMHWNDGTYAGSIPSYAPAQEYRLMSLPWAFVRVGIESNDTQIKTIQSVMLTGKL